MFQTVLGLIKFHLKDGSSPEAIRVVSKLIYAKWKHDTVYCIALEAVVKKVTKFWSIYKEGVMRLRAGREKSSAVQKYKEMVENKKALFDIFPDDHARRLKCEDEWGVKMSPAEKFYYEDQKSERKQECDKTLDPVWKAADMRKKRLDERSYEDKIMQDMRKKRPLAEIEEMLVENGVVLEDSPKKKDDNDDPEVNLEEECSQAVKRKQIEEDSSDIIPLEMRHLRESDSKVKENIYRAIADLKGRGMSLSEATQAVVLVGNRLFGRSWRVQGQETDEGGRDLRDEMPSFRSVQEAMTLMETQALAETVDRMQEGRAAGREVTHCIDSTTKKGIGQFAAQGINIGRDSAIPLPLINICGETTGDIALQVWLTLSRSALILL